MAADFGGGEHRDGIGAGGDEVGVVLPAVGDLRVRSGRDPHKETPRGFVALRLQPAGGRLLQFQQRRVFLPRHGAHGVGVGAVGGDQFALAVELPAADGRREDRRGAAGARLGDEAAEVVTERRRGVGVPLRVLLLLVVVRELDDHKVARRKIAGELRPPALADETLSAAAVHRAVVDLHRRIHQRAERHAPAAFRQVEGLVGHRGVAGEEDLRCGDERGQLDIQRQPLQR